ncbi:MAG TPA: hypothetical protein VJS92_10970 [Candidatus Polarisedimenticolaceae bacterium]|nr:hypothetical protein [Candidatus Polarisedimenticolaceae bacterium]
MKQLLSVATCVLAAGAAWAAPPSPITIEVDAGDAAQRVFHARLKVPVAPGPLVLAYPKWLPGEHGPTGPITDLAGLKLSAGGKAVRWTRDPEEMYAFHCEVPAGASTLDVALDFISPAASEGFSSGASASARLAVLSWNQVLLYPAGARSDDLTYVASLRLPEGWKFGTALPIERRGGEDVSFKPASLTTLVDSPVLMGQYFRDVDLSPGGPVAHTLHVAADGAAALELTPALETAYRKLVAEANALFGAHHYRDYHFLLTLSDHTAHFGLEHHESSDNRTYERAFIDEDRRRGFSGLLSHEMVHSWNGKYRRPAGLATPDFSEPMHGALLWVYEGLTTYLGNVLAARSGLRTPEEALESLALDAAEMERNVGRTWRPLADTAVAAQLLYAARDDGAHWRRGVDFYPEGALIWLEADVMIRQQTKGQRSLDDFCRRFHGGASGPPAVSPYTLSDVVAALDAVAPYDWKRFLEERLNSLDERPPLGGIAGAGWKLVYTEEIPAMQRSREEVRDTIDVSHSIGIELDKDGRIEDTVPGMAAAKAGIAPGMKLVAVNGRKWTRKVLREAIRATRGGAAPLELLVENADYYRSYRLDYRDGERYPHLVRDTARPDLLSAIHAPLTGAK